MLQRGSLPVLVFCALAGAAPPQPPPVPDDFKLSVSVDLVVLQATVQTRKGSYVSDLQERDFQIYEDGVRQTIKVFRHEDVPVTVGLVIDHSGSMRPKLSHVTTAARTFVQSSNPQDQMFVVNFNEKAALGLPSALPFSARPDELADAISRTPAKGMTALYDAIALAEQRLQSGRPERKVLIVISDGGDNASVHKLAEVVKRLEQSNALVYTVGIFDDADEDKNPGVLQRLAQATGGEAFFPRRLDEVVQVCGRIARDIRQQYTLGYVPSTPGRPDAWRPVRVVARAPGKDKLSVRTRTGYLAGGAR